MDWIRGERLGCGSFGQVNLAVAKNQSSFLPPLMAVKSCWVSHSSSLVNEKSVLEELNNCPEIIQCYGESITCENGEKLYNVLLEYAAGGSLADKIKHYGDRRLSEMEVRQYTKALLRGLNYIHKFGYVHCDIKLQNILLCGDGAVKIADFGLAKRSGGGGGTIRGTPMYMSPEMVAGAEQEAAADVWALGCAVVEMASGAPAWGTSDVGPLLWRIGVKEESPEIPGVFSEDGKDFLRRCFVKDPNERWTAEMLLNHPFVRVQDFQVKNGTLASPRGPFDFEDWESSASTSTSATCSITSLPLAAESDSWDFEGSNLGQSSWSIAPAERLQGLVKGQGPDWSVSDDWINVR